MKGRARERWPLVLLTLLFAVSVGIRWGAFSTKPETAYTRTGDRFTNGEVYLHTGYVFSVYQTLPVQEHKFLGYVGKSSKFLQRKGLPNLYVYTSFPPTMFVAPYLIFKLFDLPVDLLSLDVFNLALQFATVILFYFLIMELLPATRGRPRRLVAVLGASAYIFSTGTLQYHLSVYWAHELLQPFLVAALLLFAKKKGILKWWEAALVAFVLSVITWTGVFVVIGMAAYALRKLRKTKEHAYTQMAWGLAGGATVALLLVALQAILGTGADFQQYFSAVFGRAQSRTLAETYYPPATLIRNFVIWLFEDYGAYIVLAYTLAIAYVRKFKPNLAWAVVAISALPCLESFILVEHDTVYGFGRLKWLTPIILVAALGSYEFLARNTKRRTYILVGLFAVAAIFHAWWYYYQYSGTF